MPSNQEIINDYIVSNLPAMKYRDYYQELFTVPDRIFAQLDGDRMFVNWGGSMYDGKLVVMDDQFYRVDEYSRLSAESWSVRCTATGMAVPAERDQPLVSTTTKCVVLPGQIDNYRGNDQLETTIGRVFANYTTLVLPFGDVIPYINSPWNMNKITRQVVDLCLNEKITPDQVRRYINSMYFYGHSPEFVAPNITERALTAPDDHKAFTDKLWAELGPKILQGDAVAMAQYEAAQIKHDKEDYLKGDKFLDFALDKKITDICRKKLYLTHGMVEVFGKQGSYQFVKDPLTTGINKDKMAIAANEIRGGSAMRALETAKGGEESKFILRVLQDSYITQEDCQTKRAMPIFLDGGIAGQYEFRNIIDQGRLVTLTKDNRDTYSNKTVFMRSPLYCQTPNGYCFTCMGELFRKIDKRPLATAVQDLSSKFLKMALKSMHGKTVSTASLVGIDDYIL